MSTNFIFELATSCLKISNTHCDCFLVRFLLLLALLFSENRGFYATSEIADTDMRDRSVIKRVIATCSYSGQLVCGD